MRNPKDWGQPCPNPVLLHTAVGARASWIGWWASNCPAFANGGWPAAREDQTVRDRYSMDKRDGSAASVSNTSYLMPVHMACM
jgi:hypothetical protein